MKSQKLNDAQWRITAPNGSFAMLSKCFDGWEVSVWRTDAIFIKHGGIYERRFDAKVEAEKLLGETV